MQGKVGVVVMGAAIGSAQTFILREFVDKQYGTIIPGIGNWGYPSVVAGVGIGGIATLLGIMGTMGKGPLYGDAATAALSYGVPALIGGIFSALYPVTPAAGARLTAPSSAPALKTVRVTPTRTAPSAAPSTASSKILA